MPKFIVEGGHPLNGTVHIHGSKNASLPILAATLLTSEPITLHNVPDISDVHAFLDILRGFGTEANFESGTITIQTTKIIRTNAPEELVKRMRASILLLGPVLARAGEIEMVFPGGCVLGKRSVHAHTHALSKLGAEITETETGLRAKADRLKGTHVIMAEASVTATENAIMAAVLAEGKTKIHWAAMEPHVQDLCHFLNEMGAKITNIGTPTLTIEGVSELHGTEYTVTSDYLEVGTLALAALLTRGEVKLENIVSEHLDSFWEKLEEAGAPVELTANSVTLKPLPKGQHFKAVESLKTAVFPGFATDLQAPFVILLTQAEGESRVFETLFEGRLNYLLELEKMGAKVDLHNPQQATIHGPSKLKGASIISCDIRAGAAMVLAALTAEGTTEISDIRYIDRGYEQLDETLRQLGAKIERVELETKTVRDFI
ncbi:MAG: UDP-N-acetylglucosamine 1-carboxyvinyltransferase [Candidatus Peregrinibacteria bacterium]|nr:UDP-N-acetylglucosamine 1-carboxyvinyltransferase [Candidatus Peregrinibacteria bacterium]